ncbi:magnesium transporter CorA family protein [Ramlibacter sp. H39-3-26]|uniref:magnesium transporter CorA family protein n=1 Tax=Curvibacter soli TaxID=3031331 RepID=UPI0023DA2A0C|nr:magnesium transporter CorA family protein [Ramlibacter sp. H39-3-26]MDF1486477.1 magnesium transporter CorA family protein [Ramlibacter sp. H39-3-26]
MRIFAIHDARADELADAAVLAGKPPAQGFVWVSVTREEFAARQGDIQDMLAALCGQPLADLHVADLLNDQLPSHYDYTSQYDLLVFRRLAPREDGKAGPAAASPAPELDGLPRRGGPPALRRIDTRPVGFVVHEKLLLTIHPDDGHIRDGYAANLLAPGGIDPRAKAARLPTSPADLALRILNRIVDAYLDLRRDLTRQLDHWQLELVDPRSRFNDWGTLLLARQSLSHLREICEEQLAAMQDWLDALETLPVPHNGNGQRRHELLLVRGRDLVEHIERVAHHVQRLEQNAETAVQMHFSVQSHRANDIMRVLTVLTAIFLPLNLIAGVFGMNFEFIPLVHRHGGFWWAMGAMAVIAAALIFYFSRKRYLENSTR